MRIFVTGATGFVGSEVVGELLEAGHKVVGLARSDAAARRLESRGVGVHRGNLEDHDSLKRGAADSDAVIHLGFIHDFSRFADVCEIDRNAIRALGSALRGSQRSMIVASGTAVLSSSDRPSTEDDESSLTAAQMPRVATEEAVNALAGAGVRVARLRLAPSVHGAGDTNGLVPMFVAHAKASGVAAYLGDGQNVWSAVHVRDAARLARLAIGRLADSKWLPHKPHTLHAVGEESIPFRAIAEAISKQLGVPVASKPPEHFGHLAPLTGLDCAASSALTQSRFDWRPEHPGLLEDLASGVYT